MLRGIYLRVLHVELKVPTIREEITKFSVKHRDKIKHTQTNLQPHYLKKKSLEDWKYSNQQI